jgi:multidrug efflux pump subunit AcrA (membrane-fusion protein)
MKPHNHAFKNVLFNICFIFLITSITAPHLYAKVFPTILRENFKIELSSTHEGPIVLYVKEGKKIRRKEKLFGNQTKDLELKIRLAELQWKQAKATLDKVIKPLTDQELKLENLSFQQKRDLYKAGGLSKDAFQLVELDYQLKVRKSRPEDIAIAELGVNTRLVQLQLAKEALSKATFRAPLSGRVNRIFVQHNEWVKPGQKVLEILNINPLFAIVNTPLAMLTNIRIGKKIDINVKTGNQRLSTVGTVKTISDEVDAVSQTVRIRIEIKNEKNLYKPGMQAEIIF